MGDPAGIGGELAVRAWAAGRRFVAIDDPDRLARIADALGLPVPAHVVPVRLAAPVTPGRPDPANAPAIVRAIEIAVRMAQAGEASAVVTNPIHKASLTGSGFPHPGHTEFLAALTGAPRAVMMLAGPGLRVVPVTIHTSLRRAIELLTTDLIVQTARITADSLRTQWGIAAPRLALCGLNPHAGEDGTMGEEEDTVIRPAIALLRASGIDARGPFPADSLFTPEARAGYDVALGMYHDQALIPLKTLDMKRGVNVTLGLPIVRTSPDHGTAFDIAGRGIADPTSLLAALDLAADLARRSPA